MKISKTYIGATATLVTAFGILNEADALSLVNAVAVIITTVFTLYGRYKAGGVNALGLK